ncbi:MAG: dihydrodipicolinate synthase family protein [Oscillospiraceae bacterium]
MENDMMSKVKGIYTLSSMTFKEDGSIDYDAFAKLVDFLSKTGAHGVGLWGMVSEWHKVNDYERGILNNIFLEIMKSAPAASNLFVTDWCTEKAVARAKEYEKMGADTLTLLPPFYFNPSLDEVRNHMISVLEAVDIPVLIQYAPQATGHYMPDEELIEMANNYPNAAFKIEYKPAKDFLQKFLDLKSDMVILTGYAGLEMIELYKIGVRGVMPACSYTEVYVAMYNKFMSGDIAGAQKIYDMLEKYLRKWMVSPESLLAIEKELLVRRGILPNSYCRRPKYHLTEENSAEINQFLIEFAEYLK